jgi:hypothetical protein
VSVNVEKKEQEMFQRESEAYAKSLGQKGF